VHEKFCDNPNIGAYFHICDPIFNNLADICYAKQWWIQNLPKWRGQIMAGMDGA